ncbi:MAG: glycerol-3-phosphate dehydrogenase subunit GlpB [Prevotella sp.]|jgi:glycerol-3-phosphate dehydrogenase subunit B
MRYDNVIIGGGLTGLTCGIALQKAGKKVAIVAAGQSTLHFNSGSFDLLGMDEQGQAVNNPVEVIKSLSAGHPYHKVTDVKATAEEAVSILNAAGLEVHGNSEANHYRLSPMGVMKPTWLTLDGMVTSEHADRLPWKKVSLVNVRGFLDIPMEFLADNLTKLGTVVERKDFTTPELEQARKSPSEMRATNVEKVLERGDNLRRMVQALRELNLTGDVILLPAFLSSAKDLGSLMGKEIRFVATMPPSVPGVHIQTALRLFFQKQGGTFFQSDTVKGGVFSNGKLEYVTTENLVGERLMADNFVLATGSFQSHGLMSNYEKVYEPIFDLDVEFDANRANWSEYYFFDPQPYMQFGVKTDEQLHALKDGQPVDNLYAAGTVLCGCNSVKLACRGGVEMLTAIQTANHILNRR